MGPRTRSTSWLVFVCLYASLPGLDQVTSELHDCSKQLLSDCCTCKSSSSLRTRSARASTERSAAGTAAPVMYHCLTDGRLEYQCQGVS
ncbi:unnamed protein product [Danaus chrysippus]|uniref:(African queen) hypothetical protein n=1 Tax=Danaus chrysippus TaxID=151541 RepID=A0A8J2QLT1_9NEOP|nr:unnamed protein product [Danaus chrysippus]